MPTCAWRCLAAVLPMIGAMTNLREPHASSTRAPCADVRVSRTASRRARASGSPCPQDASLYWATVSHDRAVHAKRQAAPPATAAVIVAVLPSVAGRGGDRSLRAASLRAAAVVDRGHAVHGRGVSRDRLRFRTKLRAHPAAARTGASDPAGDLRRGGVRADRLAAAGALAVAVADRDDRAVRGAGAGAGRAVAAVARVRTGVRVGRRLPRRCRTF